MTDKSTAVAPLVEALDGGVTTIDGRQRIWRVGERLAGDDPVVRRNPAGFVRADLPDGERAAAKAAYMTRIATANAAERRAAEASPDNARAILAQRAADRLARRRWPA
jgi:hypothetical protein